MGSYILDLLYELREDKCHQERITEIGDMAQVVMLTWQAQTLSSISSNNNNFKNKE
jgi:hypothetical protein